MKQWSCNQEKETSNFDHGDHRKAVDKLFSDAARILEKKESIRKDVLKERYSDCTFTPKLNRQRNTKSSKIQSVKLDVVERNHQFALNREKQLSELRDKKLLNEMTDCTFSPKLCKRSSGVTVQSTIMKNRLNESQEGKSNEKSLFINDSKHSFDDGCTFMPKLIAKYHSPKLQSPSTCSVHERLFIQGVEAAKAQAQLVP